MASQPKISVIIPVYNGEKYIEGCLDALRESSCPAFEIIVVDDCSTDNTMVKAREKGAVILQPPQQSGPASARNLGAQHAKGDILLFIDSDVVVRKDTIKQVIGNFLRYPEIAATFGSYDDEPEEKEFISQYRNLFHHFHHQQSGKEATTFWAGCGAIRKNVFEEMGGFNDKQYRKPAIEDIELGYRLRQKGYRILLDKDLLVKHLKGWAFLSMVRTDILQRAIPWSQLILKTKFMPKDLNLHVSQKISSLSVALLMLTIPFLFSEYSNFLGPVAIILFLNILILNRKLYHFYVRKRGVWFMIRVIPCHILYYIYSGVTFALCWAMHRISIHTH